MFVWKDYKKDFFQARKDAFKRRHPIAHMKHSVMDHEVFPYRAEVLIIGGGLTGSNRSISSRKSQEWGSLNLNYGKQVIWEALI